jgi:uncharacterized protein
MELSQTELRVLGCMVEKQLTTPQQYPLTLNALTLACNQTSNRDPVVFYDERTVEEAVTSAKTRGLARFVHPSHGRSAIRFAHRLEEVLGVDRRQLCILAVLMLRGPQTPGELRSRTERMENFESLADIERELQRMAQRSEPLTVELPRRPGQKEERYAHLLGREISSEPSLVTDFGTLEARSDETADSTLEAGSRHGPGSTYQPASPRAQGSSLETGPPYESLESAVTELKEQVASLRADLDQLRSQLGG